MTKLVHSMIRVLNEAESVQFYYDTFGLEVVDRLDFESFTLIYLALSTSTFELELTVNKSRDTPYDLVLKKFMPLPQKPIPFRVTLWISAPVESASRGSSLLKILTVTK